MNIVRNIITNILMAFYQPFWFSLLACILFMFLVLYAREHGWKQSFGIWWNAFKKEKTFRKQFFFAWVVIMILFRTLLNRNIWTNPLVDVIGPWRVYSANGVLNTDIIENTIMMIPFSFCLFWCYDETFLKKHHLFYVSFQGLKYAFCFSLTIETLQLVLFLGTFQISDLFFNTLGGLIGGFVYFIYYQMTHKRK